MKIIKVNVFSSEGRGGNPCAIVDNDAHISSKEMQAIATELNLPETIFILRKEDECILRFFATKGEPPLCCHGSLGAAFYLSKKPGKKRLNMRSYSGIEIKIECDNDELSLSMGCEQELNTVIDLSTTCNMLAINEAVIDHNLPYAIASTGSPKLLVPVIDRKTLFDIVPNNDLISDWCKANSVNGIYAYTADTISADSTYIARNFNPLFSHKEDIAIGVSAAALCQILFNRRVNTEI